MDPFQRHLPRHHQNNQSVTPQPSRPLAQQPPPPSTAHHHHHTATNTSSAPQPPVLCYCRVHGTMGPLSQQQQQVLLFQQHQLSRIQQERLLAFHRRAAGTEREILGGGTGGGAQQTRQKSLPPQFADDSAITSGHEHRKNRHHHHHHSHQQQQEQFKAHQRRHHSVSEGRHRQQQQQQEQKPEQSHNQPPSSLTFKPSQDAIPVANEPSSSLSRRKHHQHPHPHPQSQHYHPHPHLTDPPPTYKSAPSSPVSTAHHSHRQQHQPQHKPRYNAAVMAAVARAHNAKKNTATTHGGNSDALELPHFVGPDNEEELPSPALETSLYAGCCGGREPFLLLRRKGGGGNTASHHKLGGSYSALDASSSEGGDEDDYHNCAQQQKTVTECVRNLVSWVSSVGDRVNRGTAALLDAIPNPSAAIIGGRDDHHVVMIGLDSAGKTTVLYRLKFDQYMNTAPTIGFNCERVRAPVTVETAAGAVTRLLTFQVWDVGGQEKVRPLWRPYTRATDAVVFVVDSCDKDRLEEAKLELHRIMRTPDNATVPVLIIANKQDLPGAKSPTQLEQLLQLSELRQLWDLEAVCAVTGEGLDTAMEKLHALVVKRKQMTKRARNKTR